MAFKNKFRYGKLNGIQQGDSYYVEYYKSTFYCSTSSLWLCANNLEAGDYTVSVTADGYKTLEMVITVDNSKNAAIKSVS